MAVKKTKAVATREIREYQLGAWILEQVGESTIQALADELKFSRSALSSVISGRRQAGKRILAGLKKKGLLRTERIYIVTATPKGSK